MTNLRHANVASSIFRRALFVLAVAAVAAAFAGAGVAQADMKQGNGGAKGCLIENDGKLETVPVGTKIGLFTCGQDGEWHFGWLINAISAPKSKVNPVGTGTNRAGALRKGVLHVAKSR